MSAQPQLPGQSYDFSRLDRFLEQTAARIPSGFEVMIVQDGQQLYWKAYGDWQKNQQAKIASATKWFSGALIMSLVDDGILSLDDRASRYLPYMTGEKESITIRQLMSHTSGFGGEFPLVDPCLSDPSTTLASCAESVAKTPLLAAPGTAFIYSGAGMQVAGRAAEVASGKDWQTLFRERIAEPLQMTSTDYRYEGTTMNPRISGGGRSTATDYMRFITMIQQRGLFEGRRVLSTRAVDMMLANQVGNASIVDTPALETWRYGIGNWLEDPDASGKTLRNSSTGLAGWTPLLDRERNSQVVIGMQNAVRPFQPFYPEFGQILRSLIPQSALTPGGITNAASYEAGPIAPGELITLFGNNLGPQSSATA
jgi:CubicO group peptidase (beta-lactamase class C family)